jgi:hypothetical protein
MWRGYEWSLYVYIQEMVKEWLRRGFKSTIGEKATKTFLAFKKRPLRIEHPAWLEDIRTSDPITASHRMALLVKNYEWYSQFGWEEDPGYPITEYEYVWPVE